MQMPYWGYPGQDAWLTTQEHILKSQLQWCKLCNRLPSKVLQILDKAYSYDLHILDTVQDSQQVTCMTLED